MLIYHLLKLDSIRQLTIVNYLSYELMGQPWHHFHLLENLRSPTDKKINWLSAGFEIGSLMYWRVC